MPVYYDKRNKRWRFTFNQVINRNRIRITKLLPKTWNRHQAKEFDQKETARLFGTATGTIKQKHLISQAVVLYCQHKCPELKGGGEIEKELARLFGYYEGRYVEELADVARDYRETEQDRVKPATVKNKLSYLRAACNYAHKFHKFEAPPPVELPRVKNERQSFIVRREMVRLARSLKGLGAEREARTLVRIAFYSGMRLSEIMSIGHKSSLLEDGFKLIDTKNGEDRYVPMHPKITSAVKYLPITYSKKWMQVLIRRAMNDVGLNEIRLHDLRHSTATNLINSEKDLYLVRELLGHKDIRTTQRYSHVLKKTLQDFVKKIK